MYRYACDTEQHFTSTGEPFLRVPCLPTKKYLTDAGRRTHGGGEWTPNKYSECFRAGGALAGGDYLSGVMGLNGVGVEPTGAAADVEAANRAAANQVSDAVTAAYFKAALALGIRAQMGAADWALDTLNVADALRKNTVDLGKRIIDWRVRMRSWAENGRRDDGSAFSWKQWVDLGRTYADAASSYASISWDSSPLNVVFQATARTAQQANPFNPTEWPTWLKVAAAIAAVGGAAYVVNTAVAAKRAFTPAPLYGLSRRTRKRRSRRR